MWAGKMGMGGYGRIQVWVPGLRGTVTMQAHVALWVWCETQPESTDDFYLFYREYVISGMEVDHLCTMPCCINPDHLEGVTASVNTIRKFTRVKGR